MITAYWKYVLTYKASKYNGVNVIHMGSVSVQNGRLPIKIVALRHAYSWGHIMLPPRLMFVTLSRSHQSGHVVTGTMWFFDMWLLFMNTECTVAMVTNSTAFGYFNWNYLKLWFISIRKHIFSKHTNLCLCWIRWRNWDNYSKLIIVHIHWAIWQRPDGFEGRDWSVSLCQWTL